MTQEHKPTETPRERFLRVAQHRVNMALKYVRLIENIARQPYYAYQEVEIAAIFAELDKAVAKAKEAFAPEAPKEKPPVFDLAAIASDAPLLEHIERENRTAAKSTL